MTQKALRASEIAAELAKQLSTRSRHIVLFLGAGASRSAGLPDMEALKGSVVAALDEEERRHFEGRDVESGLSRLRRLTTLLADGEQVGDLTPETVRAADGKACAAIINALNVESRPDAFDALGRWAASLTMDRPAEIVTVNYDLLIEAGLDRQAAPYFDGFVGTIRARFREDLIEPKESRIPSFFTRLWKLHGSVNWRYEHGLSSTRIVRLGAPDATDAAAIYPTDEKYDESRRVPFVVLMDRFRRALAENETLAFVCGYSFRDQHLNEILYDAAARHSRNHYVCLSYTEPPAHLVEQAERIPNITVLARDEYISGGTRCKYSTEDAIPNITDGTRCLLPDFAHFSVFLRGSEALVAAEA